MTEKRLFYAFVFQKRSNCVDFFPAKFRVSSGEVLQFHPDVLLKKSCTSSYVISPIIYKGFSTIPSG